MHRFMELQKDAPVLTPDILILSVGTEIRLGSSLEVDKVWAQELDDGWDRDIIVQEALKMPDLRFQEEPDQGSHKVSFKVDRSKGEEMQNILSMRLLNRGLKVRVVYSSGVDLDVLPYKAGKGQALSYLVAKLNENGMIHKNVLVCGDSGNDIDLFTVKGVHGVIVSNAQEELVKWHWLNNSNGNILRASQRCAAAIVEALHHFNFGPHVHQTEKICEKPLHNSDYSSHLGAVHREVVGLNMFMVKWLLGEVPNSESSFSRLSCVLNDNMKVILPEGIELTAEEFICKIRREYGSLQESGLYIWVDKVTAKQLAEGLYLVTWQPWERLSGMPKKGYYASAILKSKVEAPNGMEWLHYHKTLRELMDIQSLQ
ncbi:hypothetical protein KP509_19G056600 [Ceratopteris richardii]|nr:hypothetical protein KP509_19G056600 [Ceratopteris richardii]